MSVARQQIGIYIHGDKVVASATHGGKIPQHGGVQGPVHGSPNPDPGGGGAFLNPLFLSNSTINENSPNNTVVGDLLILTGGSTVTLINDAGTRFKLVGSQIQAAATPTDYESATSHNITVRETLAGASNSPRDSVITINVNNVFEVALAALGGSFSLPEDALANAVAGTLTGKTAGSTLSLTNDAGGRVALSGTNIVRGATALDYETATSHNFTVRETHADASAPRDTVLTLSVTDVAESALRAPVLSDPAGFVSGANPPVWNSLSLDLAQGDTVQYDYTIGGGALDGVANITLIADALDENVNIGLPSFPSGGVFKVAERYGRDFGSGIIYSPWSNTWQDTLNALAFAPSDLFGGADVGYAWDTTDWTKLFTDAGLTNVAAYDVAVQRMLDISGKGNFFSGSGTERPVIRNVSNGLLQFDASNDVMTNVGGIYAKGATTIIMAVRDTQANANNAPFFWSETNTGNGNPVYAPGTRQNVNQDVLNYHRNDAQSGTIANNMDVNCWDGTLKILAITDNGTSVSVSVDGAAAVTNSYTRNTPLTGNMSAIGMARNAGGTFGPYGGYIGCGIVIGRVLTGALGTAGTEMTKAYNWVAAKHGKTLL